MTKEIFEKSIFEGYRTVNLSEARKEVTPHYKRDGSAKTTVFISHKHDDLEEISGLIGLLEKKYDIKAYIDSRDSSMPNTTSGITASKIKQRIIGCKKFILLATNGAIESKWCNWELGYGDAKKYDSNDIAVFAIKPENTQDSMYKGHEYLQIYPYIAYYDGNEKYTNGCYVKQGFYICKKNGINKTLEPLEYWLNS